MTRAPRRRGLSHYYAALLALASLAGCAEFDAARTGVARHGATAADSALGLAKWQVCTATSVGALERDLGADRERILGWMLWCAKKPGPHPLLSPAMPEVPAALPQGFAPLGGPGTKEIGL